MIPICVMIKEIKKESSFTYLNPFNNYINEPLYNELKKIKNINYHKTYISPKIYDYYTCYD